MWSKMYMGLHVKYRLFWLDFNETWILWTGFRIIPPVSNFMKIRPVGAELFRADGRTAMMTVIVAFRTFVKANKNVPINWVPSAHGLVYWTEQMFCTNLNCGFCVLCDEQCASLSDSDVWFLILYIIQCYFFSINSDANR